MGMKLPLDLASRIADLADATPGQPIDAGLLRDPSITSQATAGQASKPSKYRNQKIEHDGFVFDSKKEFRRYLDLRAEQQAGTIEALRCQVDFPVVVNGVEVCRYVADFTYRRAGREVVEDVKSEITRRIPVYRLKRKLLAALGVEVDEI